MEQFVESGILKASMLSGNFRNSDSVCGGSVRELCGVFLFVLGNLSKSLGDLARTDEGGNVRVMA